MKLIKNSIIIILCLAVLAVVIFLITAKRAVSPEIVPEAVPVTTTTDTNPTNETKSMLFTDATHSVSFSHPADLFVDGTIIEKTNDWMNLSDMPGTLLAVMKIEKAFMPSTNFSEAKFTIGKNITKKAVDNCLLDTTGAGVTKSEVTINGTTYTKWILSDAGAGNYYETTSYRTVKNNTCYAVEYVVHSTSLGAYSPDQGITQFDKAKVENILETVVKSVVII